MFVNHLLLKMNLWACSILSNLLKRCFNSGRCGGEAKDAENSINLYSYKYCQAFSGGLLLTRLLLCQLASYNEDICLNSQRPLWVLGVEWWEKSILKTLPVLKRKWTPTYGFNILHWIAQSSSLCSHLTLSNLLFGNSLVEGSVTIGKIFHSSTAPWGFLQASIHVFASLLMSSF